MPPKPKSPQEIQEEQDFIINKALEIISELGIEKLTMRLLAARCSTSTSKIYYYFINKDAVAFAIMEKGFKKLRYNMERAYLKGSSPVERFVEVARAFFHFGITYPDYYEIMLSARRPRRLEFSEGPIEEIAIKEKEAGLDFYMFWEKCLNELAVHYNKQLNQYDTIKFFAQIHGAINLEHSNNLKEINISYKQLSEYIIEDIVNSFSK